MARETLMTHDHCGHSHDGVLHGGIKKYWIVAFVTFVCLVLELVGGISSKSLALLSDGLHVALDLGSVLMVIFIEYYVRRKTVTDDGKKRMRAIGGIAISVFIFISMTVIFKTAIERLAGEESVNSLEMTIYAIIGLVGNVISLWILGDHEENHTSHKALTAHVISDLIQSIGVVFVGCMMFFTDWQLLDVICSFLICLFLLRISLITFVRSIKSM